MAYHHYKTKAIFLDKQDRGEADQIFTIFAQEFGKIEVLGKAIRKITSKLKSGADVFYCSEIEFVQGKRHKILTDVFLIDKFANIARHQPKFEAAKKIANALYCFIKKEEKDEHIWQLLLESFIFIENLELKIENSLKIENWKLEIIYYYFLWRLFALLGYSPELYNCAVCSKALLPETLFFSAQDGGVVCWRCFDNSGAGITVETIKILRFWLKNDLPSSLKLNFSGEAKDNICDVSELYCNFLQGQVL